MEKNHFDNFMVSFGRPDSEISDYQYIKEHTGLMGGGLKEEVVLSAKTVPLSNLMRDFCGVAGFSWDLLGSGAALLIGAVITISLDVVNINKFPDSYQPMIKLLKDTPRGAALDSKAVEALLKEQPDLAKVLDALVNENFLIRKTDNSYAVRRKILMHKNYNFK